MAKSITPPNFSEFENHYELEGFKLTQVRAAFLPLDEYSVKVKVEKGIEPNRYSLILLRLVEAGCTTKTEICEQLGIQPDDFTLIQLDYLLRQNCLYEYAVGCYNLTLEGREFLNGESHIREVVEERLTCYFSPALNEWLDHQKPIDSLSEGMANRFKGYQLVGQNQCRELDKAVQAWQKGAKELSFGALVESGKALPTNQDVFCQFAEKLFPSNFVYEILKTHSEGRKYIPFLAFVYSNNESNEIRHDIRRFVEWTHQLGDYESETKLSQKIAKKSN